MKKFEFPYNWNKFDIYDAFDKHGDVLKQRIETIYFPPFCEDSFSTRLETKSHPVEREDYLEHLNFAKSFGLPMTVLFQDQQQVSDKIIRYYVEDLGFSSCIVYLDANAYHIKELYPNLNVVASITKSLKFKDICEKDLSMYDHIVLDFRFNRALSKVSQLPKKYKYIIMPNNLCTSTNWEYCQKHWFEGKRLCNIEDDVNRSTIYIKDLKYFEPFVSYFKLQGREWFGPHFYSMVLGYIVDDFYNDKYEVTHSQSYYNRFNDIV